MKTGSGLFEIPDDPRIHAVNPQMKLFIRVSTEITKLFYRFVPEKCVHTYSVDESFLDAGKQNPEEMAKSNSRLHEERIWLSLHCWHWRQHVAE
ncbi:hypothetical protein J7E23_14695 [Pseudomonas sp. ISL-88]|nr:hypothetical protein [Pseudomonas sp. ISL-88]